MFEKYIYILTIFLRNNIPIEETIFLVVKSQSSISKSSRLIVNTGTSKF